MIIRWLLKWMRRYRIKYRLSSVKRILRGFARSGAWIAYTVAGIPAFAFLAFYLLLLLVISVLIICYKTKK